MYDWALYRTSKGGVKIHTMLDHDSYLPVWAYISNANEHDQKVIETIDPISGLTSGAFVTMDRAYVDFKMLYRWDSKGINYVLRAKDGMNYAVESDLEIPEGVGKPKDGEQPRYYVISDQIISLTGQYTRNYYPKPLRLVTYWIDGNDESNKKNKNSNRRSREVKFITNNLQLTASDIAAIYKNRWLIEAFFKLIKRNLKVKSFLGTSANAVKIQIYTALISIVLLRCMQASLTKNMCIPHLLQLLRSSLYLYIHMVDWINHNNSQKSKRSKTGDVNCRGKP
jgi:hypothetical protein